MDTERERRQTPDDEGPDEATYADAKRKQDHFEQLLEEHDGDFQAASDALLRGEQPEEHPEGGQSA